MMESAAQEKVRIKTEPTWDSVSVEDAPSSPVFIKDEPPSDGSVEVRSSCLDVSVKEEILNSEASCSNGIETSLDVTVKVERVKEECGVSARAAAEGLYAGHAVTGELVLGPTLVERREAASTDKGRAPQEEQAGRHDTYRCEHCDYTTARRSALVRHMRKHTSKKLCCEHCDYTSGNKALLRKHLKIHTGERPYKCDQCSYAAVQKFSSLRNKKLHIGDRSYKCDQSSYTTAFKHAIALHEMIHTGEKPYKCDQCSYATVLKHAFEVHEMIHTGKKPYKCDQCSYANVFKHALAVHKRIHEKPYKCGQCSYATAYRRNLSVHERMHNGEKNYKRGPYQCSQCTYATVKKSNLITHERIHTGEKPHKCGQCNYASNRLGNLRSHEKTHSGQIGQKQYKCWQFRFASAHKSHLRDDDGVHTEASSTTSLANSAARALVHHDHTYSRVEAGPATVLVKQETEEVVEKCVKEECEDPRPRGVSEAAALVGLYADHVVKDELVMGPERPHRPDVGLIVSEWALGDADGGFVAGGAGRVELASSARLERLSSDAASLADQRGTDRQHTTRTDTDSDIEDEIYAKVDYEKEPICDICGKSFKLKSDLIKHVMIHIHQPTSVEEGQGAPGFDYNASVSCAETCGPRDRASTYVRPTHARDSSALHTIIAQYQCLHCGKCFRRKEDSIRHIQSIHTHSSRPSRKSILRHEVSHTQWRSGSQLWDHEVTHTGEKPHQCSFCHFKCRKRSQLRYHEITHTGEKPVKCNYCNYKCIWKSELRKHMSIHTDEKPFKCTLCHYTCKTKRYLRIHHTQNRHTQNRHKHTDTTHRQKPIKCSYCESSFYHIEYLRIHEKSHSGASFTVMY